MRVAAFLVCFLASSQVFAQAWVHKPGTGYAEVGVRHAKGDAFYGVDGEPRPIASAHRQTSVTMYGEVGVVERWLQLTVGGEVFRRSALEGQGATQGLGDLRVGAFTGLLQESALKISAGVQVDLPTGDPSPSSGTGDPAKDLVAATLPTGSGTWSVTPTVAVGSSFGGGDWPLDHYVSSLLGYQARIDYGDSLTWSVELGARWRNAPILRFVTFRARLSGLEALQRPEISSYSSVGDDVSHTTIGGGAAISVWRGVGVHAMAERAVRAKRIIRATPLTAGVFLRF